MDFNKLIKIENTDISLNKLKKKSEALNNLDLREQINNSKLLLIPTRTVNEKELYPEGTGDFYRFLIDQDDSKELLAEFIVDDENYGELELHSDIVYLATMVFSGVVLPIIINVVSDYITEMRKRKNEEFDVEVSYIFEEDGGKTSKKITYKGKAENFDETMKSLKENFENDRQN
ncbi:hypothetical protein LI951_14350 [Enterococcus sp. BWT-B8]|uniref:hypothetical protein n=1 Tax=Enterococcus sp. BWT-B8 TaxID=2885157 RepID=UPI001E304B4F|nr:hypothetical protein [Enterococcus sp. BWT-B8]MCB5953253.1 hypothetical protein [Enterococcus sp. BWT-B8]